jgi:hypothetical protein
VIPMLSSQSARLRPMPLINVMSRPARAGGEYFFMLNALPWWAVLAFLSSAGLHVFG